MSVVFPNSNLPTSSQPWGREVQKQLASLIDATQSESINNAARDNQLNSSIIALTNVVNDVKNVLTEVGILEDVVLDPTDPTKIDGTNLKVGSVAATAIVSDSITATQIKANTITADEISTSYVYAGNISANQINAGTLSGDYISGGTISGVNFETTGSVESIDISSGEILFYSGSSLVARAKGESGLFVLDNFQTGTGSGIAIGSSSASLFGRGSGIQCGAGGSGRIEVNASSGTEWYGPITFNGRVFGPGMDAATTNVSNVRRNTGTAAELVHTNESSIRFKKDVVDLNTVEELDPKKLLDIPVRAFKYKEDYPLSPNDGRYGKLIPGFIAEEVYEAYPIGADLHDEDHSVIQNWNERIIIPGMLALIQELYARIETLEKGA